jgi:2-iminoacetate synthase ThiH
MAEPQPNVLNFDSTILPSSSTLICNFITSPHAGAPTSPYKTKRDERKEEKEERCELGVTNVITLEGMHKEI